MAIELTKVISIELGNVVSNSIAAVKAVRRSEQARKEAEFQRAIADGLSYEEQIKMREQQLEDAKASGIPDEEYILDLEKSIADTKKLNRFNKYRTKYTTTFADLVSGRINEKRYLDVLENQLKGVQDPELALEIQKNIAAAEEGLKAYNDTILSNKVKLAKYDGSVRTLASMVAQVKIARANAVINDKQDEVTSYDETLAALNSQLSSVRIEDAMLDFQAKSETRGTNALEKLEFMNNQIRSADPDSPVRIADGNGGAKTYSSAQEFWTSTRDNYLSGNFFKELDENIKTNISANTKVAGISQATIDNTAKIFNDLKARPEFVPFMQRLEAEQNVTVNNLVGQFANRWIDVAGRTGDFAQASQQIGNAGKRYGADVVSFIEALSGKAESLVEGGEAEVVKAQPTVEAEKVEPTPLKTALTTPATSAAPQVTPPAYDPATGFLTDYGASIGAKPVQPNDIRETTPPSTTPAPKVSPQPTTTPTPMKPSTPTVPQSTPKPVTPTTPQGYTGNSIVDYLKSVNQDSSFASRAKLASEKGITNYRGEAKQNEELLKLLRG